MAIGLGLAQPMLIRWMPLPVTLKQRAAFVNRIQRVRPALLPVRPLPEPAFGFRQAGLQRHETTAAQRFFLPLVVPRGTDHPASLTLTIVQRTATATLHPLPPKASRPSLHASAFQDGLRNQPRHLKQGPETSTPLHLTAESRAGKGCLYKPQKAPKLFYGFRLQTL